MERKKTTIISFEGPEGSGKTTFIEGLKRYLKTNGFSYAIFREPGSTVIGEEIRNIILHPKNKKMDVYTELLLYLACRTQLLQEKVRPLLGKKHVIILDRYFDSTVVYQGYAGGLDIKFVSKIVDIFCLGIKPDITFFLDVKERVGLKRSKRTDRMEKKSYEFHRKVRNGYKKRAKMFPKRIILIKDKHRDLILKEILSVLKSRLKK